MSEWTCTECRHEDRSEDSYPCEDCYDGSMFEPKQGARTMGEKPKTCPFCGKPPYVKIDYRRNRVKCTNASCLVQPATAYFRTIEEAINAWNRRDGEKHEHIQIDY